MDVKTFWDWLRYAVITLGGRQPPSHFLSLFQSSYWSRNTPIFEAAQHDDSFCGTVATVMTHTHTAFLVCDLVGRHCRGQECTMPFLSCCVNQTASENKTRRLLPCPPAETLRFSPVRRPTWKMSQL